MIGYYVPLARYPPQPRRTLTVRAAAGVDAVARGMAEVIREIEPAAVPPVVGTLRESIGRQMSPQRLGSAVLGGLGAIALLLTALSVFVLGDAMATFRTRELGIRSALGATGADLIRLLLVETIRPVMIGIAAGIGASIAGARFVRAFAFQVEPVDPLRFCGRRRRAAGRRGGRVTAPGDRRLTPRRCPDVAEFVAARWA